MHAFFRRMWQSRKHSGQKAQPTTTVGRKTSTKKGKNLVRNESFDGDSWQRREISLSACPDIYDNGSPTPNRYADPGLYWNSGMLEAISFEEHSQQASSPTTSKYTSGPAAHAVHNQNFPTDQAQPQRSIGRIGSVNTRIRSNDRANPTNKTVMTQPGQPTRFAEELKDNDPAILQDEKPRDTHYTTAPVLEPTRPKISFSTRTRDYGEFVDIPCSRSSNIAELDDERNIFIAHASSSNLVGKAYKNSGYPLGTKEFTWDSCLYETLHHPDTNPSIRTAIDDRLQRTDMMNGITNDARIPLNIQNAGLVPNFSRPIPASGFHDRIAEEEKTHQAMNYDPLSNGDVVNKERFDEFVFEEPHINGVNLGLELEPQEGTRRLTNGYTSSSPPSRSPSSTTLDSLYRPPSPAVKVINGVTSELSDTLTPSELNALHKILTTKLKSLPIEISLIRKLHNVVQGFQDRTKHVEKTPWPQINEALEQKAKVIDMLTAGIENLETITSNLSTTVDFGNKILQGCWTREYELWRTLIYLRDKKRYQCLRKLLIRFIPAGEQGVSPHAGKKHQFSSSELDVLVLIAEQNLKIFKDDVSDMAGMVEVCMDQMTSCGVDRLGESK